MKHNFFKRLAAFGLTAVLTLGSVGTAFAADTNTTKNAVQSFQTASSTAAVQPTKSTKTIKIGEQVQPYLTVNGLRVSLTNWKSSKRSVAKVSSNGWVTAYKAGKSVISGKYRGKTYYWTIYVKAPKITGFTKLKKVIQSQGHDITFNGVKCKYLGANNSKYNFYAFYLPNKNTIEFVSEYTEGNTTFYGYLSFPSKTGSTAKFLVNGYQNNNVVYIAQTKKNFKRSTFKTTSKPKFKVIKKSVSKNTSNTKMLHESMIGWAYIAEQSSTSLYDFGFHFYGRTLNK